MDNSALKVLIIVLLLVYILSPVDAVPGPIDDILLLVFASGAIRG